MRAIEEPYRLTCPQECLKKPSALTIVDSMTRSEHAREEPHACSV